MKGSSPTSGQPRRAWVPYFVLAVALVLTLIAAYYVSVTAEARDRSQFQNSVQHAQTSIQSRLETYIAGLRAGSALFSASDEVTREEFRTYVESLDFPRRFPGVQGIGFSLRVKPDEIDALVSRMRKEGFDHFRIWPDAAGCPVSRARCIASRRTGSVNISNPMAAMLRRSTGSR